jgi:hypothetical protein
VLFVLFVFVPLIVLVLSVDVPVDVPTWLSVFGWFFSCFRFVLHLGVENRRTANSNRVNKVNKE